MIRIAILGAGGFAREVEWLIRSINENKREFDFQGFIVKSVDDPGIRDRRDRILGDEDWLELHHEQIDALAIGIGNPAVRLRLGRDLASKYSCVDWPSLIHPTVIADTVSCEFRRGTVLCAGTIATVNVIVDEFAMVNLSCTLGHESVVGAGSVVNPSVNVSGGVTIGEGVLIGTGAQILENIVVGNRARLGSGAVVTRNVEAGTTVVGVPAKPISR